MKLGIGDLEFGKSDAKNESKESKEFFIDSFFMPDNFPEEEYYSGSRYYIEGAKGTGKTALLRYMDSYISKSENNISEFILFSTNVNEAQRIEFLNNLGVDDLNNMKDDEINTLDFEHIWKIYFHQKILNYCTNSAMFYGDENWKKYKKTIEALEKRSFSESISFSPFQFKNKTTVSTAALNNTTEISSEISYNQYKVALYKKADELDNLFLKLKPTNMNLYIFIDELELTKINERTYKRDIILIRDLILTISKLNSLSKEIGNSIKFITAIRTEVIRSVHSSGKEINKIMNDFGFKLSWTQNGGSFIDNPLIKILIKKIRSSENLKNIDNKTLSDIQIWNKYLPREVSIYIPNQKTESYILRQTFMKPRDIVRLFTEVKKKFGKEENITQKVLEGVRDEYAQETWQEVLEELTVKYTNEELNCIKFLLSASDNFYLSHFESKIENSKRYFPEMVLLLKKHSPFEILRDLYNVGVIGNSTENKVRFSYRGQEHLLYDERMIIHESLRKALT